MSASPAIATDAREIFASAQRMCGATDRCERYADRLDAHLATLPDNAARLAFVKSELAKWEVRYTEWAAKVDAGRDPGGITAFDFTITLADVAKRRSLYEPADETPPFWTQAQT